MTHRRVLGVIGGSGLSQIEGLSSAETKQVASPWGQPSAPLTCGQLEGTEVVFLPRHGEDYSLSPTFINYRANIDALKRAGVTDVLSVSICGSLQEHLPPGTFVIVDQFIDHTVARARSFFGDGVNLFVSLASPVSSFLCALCEDALKDMGTRHHMGGTYIAIEGPQLSTKAESQLFRSWGGDVIGMTNMPEAKLAREAELRYASVALVSDFDAWHPHQCDREALRRTVRENASVGPELVRQVARALGRTTTVPTCGCDRALDGLFPEEGLPEALIEKYDAIAGRFLHSRS